MSTKEPRSFATLILILLIFSACRTTEVEIRERMDSGYYQNHVESDLVRSQIKNSFKSVRRIQSTVSYRTYLFYEDDMPIRSELEGADLESVSVLNRIDNQSTAGTAIVAADADRGRVALVTAAHTVTFPDTLWHYAEGEIQGPNGRVEAVSVRESLHQFVFTDDGIEMLELLEKDERRDLAVMKTTQNVPPRANLEPLRIPSGDVSRLEWGDMIYAAGHPRGVQMVTQGIVSRTQHPIRSIIMDISLNRGFSGGAVFAVRSDGSGLEWVGVITSTMGEREQYLAPAELLTREYPEDVEYFGEVYVKTATRIYYGMTNAVDINQLNEFLQENSQSLRNAGVRILAL